MIQVSVGIGVGILSIVLFVYDAIQTKKELGEWKNDRK
jgi:hypothetical protein